MHVMELQNSEVREGSSGRPRAKVVFAEEAREPD
jgi:hypothetical protein